MNLNIGCGPYPIEGFINTDINIRQNVSYLNAETKFNYDDNSFDFIYSCHCIEHLSYKGFHNYLNETYRCLKPNGVHRVCFPSLDKIKLIINNPENYFDYIYNVFHFEHEDNKINKDNPFIKDNYNDLYSLVISNLFCAWGHNCLYDEKLIIKLFRATGYKNIVLKQLNESDYPIFKDIEIKNGTNDFILYKQYESSVIEATK